MQQFTKEQLMALNPKQVYRLLLKNIKFYPSKNRFELMLTIKEEYRKNRNLSDEKEVFVERKKGWMGLAHVLYYREKVNFLNDNYALQDRGMTEPLNPKDKDFIYF